MNQMTRKPTTPGEILLEEFLNPIEMTQSTFAKHIGVDYKTINRLVGGGDLSPELAQKIAAATKTSVELWINLQTAVTVWELKHNKEKLPKPIIDFGSNNAAMMIKTQF